MNFNSNKRGNSAREHSPMKHMLHMILCCGIPALIIMTLPFIARYSPAAAGLLGIVAPFICPVMMGGMIIMMLRSGKHSCCSTEEGTPESVTKAEQEHALPTNKE